MQCAPSQNTGRRQCCSRDRTHPSLPRLLVSLPPPGNPASAPGGPNTLPLFRSLNLPLPFVQRRGGEVSHMFLQLLVAPAEHVVLSHQPLFTQVQAQPAEKICNLGGRSNRVILPGESQDRSMIAA